MANYYSECAEVITIPPEKMERAWEIVNRVLEELEGDEEEDTFVTFRVAGFEGGLLITTHESIDPDQLHTLVKALVEELDLPGITACSWAYTCDKQRPDAFGGMAFAVRKGYETVWVHAREDAIKQAEQLS